MASSRLHPNHILYYLSQFLVRGSSTRRPSGSFRAFSGKDEDWPAWVFVARGYVHLLDRAYRGMLEAAENAASQNELSMIDMSDTAQELSTVLFNLLTQSVDGRALQILMNVEGQNGFQAWKALCDAYEPPVGGRHMAMLTAIIAPDWKNIKESEILETIESWEVLVRRYEMQSKETVSESMRVAVLMKHVPSPVKDAMRAAGTQIGTNYERAKKFIRDYLQTGNIYKSGGALAKDDGGLAPMDVGAVSHAEKGKKGKSSKGDKGVNKGGKYDKQGKGKAPITKKFNGECSYCGKWGHKKADCRTLVRDRARRDGDKGKGKNSTNAVQSSFEWFSCTTITSGSIQAAAPMLSTTGLTPTMTRGRHGPTPMTSRTSTVMRCG